MKLFNVLFLGICLSGLIAVPATAHNVNVFGYQEGEWIKGEGYYSGGGPARQARITVYQLKPEARIAETRTDDQGQFQVRVKPKRSVKIVMNAGQGHRAEFVLENVSDVPRPNQDKASPKSFRRVPISRLSKVVIGLIVITGLFTVLYWSKKHAS
jgi:nickel transport protein